MLIYRIKHNFKNLILQINSKKLYVNSALRQFCSVEGTGRESAPSVVRGNKRTFPHEKAAEHWFCCALEMSCHELWTIFSFHDHNIVLSAIDAVCSVSVPSNPCVSCSSEQSKIREFISTRKTCTRDNQSQRHLVTMVGVIYEWNRRQNSNDTRTVNITHLIFISSFYRKNVLPLTYQFINYMYVVRETSIRHLQELEFINITILPTEHSRACHAQWDWNVD